MISAAKIPTGLKPLWPARTWQATYHVVLGVPVALATGLAFGGLMSLWLAAIWSLAEGPTGGSQLAIIYAVMTVAGPFLLLGVVGIASRVHRIRFREALGVGIPAPPYGKRPWLLRGWLAAATWRQLAYHLLALPIGAVGGVVAACWSVAFIGPWYAARSGLVLFVLTPLAILAAPWLAVGLAQVDETVAKALLGAGRNEELARRVESLTRSRAEIVAATDAERRRIERDLHDGAQQRLVALAMNLGMARAGLAGTPESAREVIEQAHDDATQALAELRELVRGLHPAVLNDRGLDAALSGLAARAPLPVKVRVDMPERCSPSIEAIAYFVVSEGFTNIAKHAHASRAEVTVERTGDRLRIIVTDDGRGGATLAEGGGLRGLAQRVAAVDGTLKVHSPPGGPTTITAELPCE